MNYRANIMDTFERPEVEAQGRMNDLSKRTQGENPNFQLYVCMYRCTTCMYRCTYMYIHTYMHIIIQALNYTYIYLYVYIGDVCVYI